MTSDQKIVAVGAASGVVLMVLAVWLLAHVLPAPMVADSLAERLAYALGANVFALIPLFIMLITVGNRRFLSRAIDPTERFVCYALPHVVCIRNRSVGGVGSCLRFERTAL